MCESLSGSQTKEYLFFLLIFQHKSTPYCDILILKENQNDFLCTWIGDVKLCACYKILINFGIIFQQLQYIVLTKHLFIRHRFYHKSYRKLFSAGHALGIWICGCSLLSLGLKSTDANGEVRVRAPTAPILTHSLHLNYDVT